jgi:hypothetical protein
LAATVTIPLASIINGPVVNGVTLVLVVVAAMLLNVISMRSMPLLPYCLMQQLPMDHSSSIGLFTTTVAVAVSQFAGLTFNLLMDCLQLVGDAVRTTCSIGCNGYYSVSINAQWSCR